MDVEEKVQSLERRLETLEEKFKTSAPGTTDLRDFVARVNPENHRDRVKAIGYYLEHQEGQRNFTKNDIEEAYDELKRSYSNPSMLLRRMFDDDELIKDGEDENGAIQWRLHAETERFVEGELSNDS